MQKLYPTGRERLDHFVRHHRPLACYWAHRYLSAGQEGLVDECVQDAFYDAARVIDRFDPRREFEPWIRRFIQRACGKFRRRARRESLRVVESAVEELVEPDTLLDRLCTEQEQAQTRKRLERALSQLAQMAPRAAGMIEAVYLEERSREEIHVAFDCNAMVFNSALYRARKQLRQLMEQA